MEFILAVQCARSPLLQSLSWLWPASIRCTNLGTSFAIWDIPGTMKPA